MLTARDEADCRKLVIFYVMCTSIYFPCVLLCLYWSSDIYMVGKFNFQPILLVIMIAEVMKYFAGSLNVKKHNYNLLKGPENHTLLSYVISLFTKAKLREGCKTGITVFIMIVIYFIASVLYGAEIFTKHEETFMFSALLSILTVFPICMNLGCHSVISVLLGCKPVDKLEHLMYQNFFVTVLGAWLGAFVIPLDWDRPWQEWPIPCSFGAMMGFLLSHFLMILQVMHFSTKKKIKNNEQIKWHLK